jgi:hypothetical protein
MRFLPAAALTLQQVQGRNKSRDGASADTAGGRLKSRIGFTAEPIHRSADPRPVGQAETTRIVVRPIRILSPFLSAWAANMRRPLRKVPFVELRSSTYHTPWANWKRAW